MECARGAAQVADCLAVVGVWSKTHAILGDYDTGGHAEIAGDPVFILDERLRRRGNEMLVEVRQGGVDPRARISRNLVAIGVRPLKPQACPQSAAVGIPTQGRDVADFAISVQFVDAAGGSDANSRAEQAVGAK